MLALRDYQSAAIKAVQESYTAGTTRSLVSLPTGCGKTVVFCTLAQMMNRRTLILAHRDELITQAVDKLKMVWPDADVGVVKAKQNDYEKPVVVASIQTLGQPKRLDQIAASDAFELCIVDESHHASSPTYRRVLERLGFMGDNPDKLLVGVTATVNRSDGAGLDKVFQTVAYHMPLTTAIREGYLSDIRGIKVTTQTDLSSVGVRNGDFVEYQLANVVNTNERNTLVAQAYNHYARGRKTIVFAADVAHAEALATTFQSFGIPSACISGDTPQQVRKDILDKFDTGEIQVVSNCAVLTEGYDQPDVSCVIMARPTKSTVLYTQCIGRGTRRAPGKQDCIVLDFFDGRHDVCAVPSLVGLSEEEIADGKSVREAIQRVESQSTNPNITSIEASEFDPLGRSQFRWFEADGEWWLPVSPGVHVVLHRSRGSLYKIILKQKGEKDTMLHQTTVSLGYAQGIGEDYARKHGNSFARRDASWRDHPASEKQILLLQNIGAYQDGLTKGEACDILDRYFASNKRYRKRA